MLSYRHAFHAGNHADVLKHLVVCSSLDYMIQKPTPIVYIDTHAGAGSYALNSKQAQKKAEYKTGVAALDFSRLPETAGSYEHLVRPLLKQQHYPGSPLLAARLLREQDKLRLFEMHSSDFPLLKQLFKDDKRAIVNNSDGFQGIKALLPVKNARALLLIDPSYEIKSDYQLVADAIKQAGRRMANAHIFVWYPVVDRKRTEKMIQAICNSGLRDIWRFELCMEDDNKDYGMTGSGVLAINPPWVLAEQMRQLLPALVEQLSPNNGFCSIEQLVAE